VENLIMGDSGLLLGRPKGAEDFALEGDEEEEGDLDAFNDETFGGEAAEWEESGNFSHSRVHIPAASVIEESPRGD
jgi:hypothetical protein